jgi:hypothetical protein
MLEFIPVQRRMQFGSLCSFHFHGVAFQRNVYVLHVSEQNLILF